MSRVGRRERGSASLEAVAALTLAVLVISGLATAFATNGTALAAKTTAIYCSVTTGAPCAVKATTTGSKAGTGSTGGQVSGDKGGRRDQERGTVGDRGRRGSGGPGGQSGTPGQDNGQDPLGTPVDGTSVPTPDPPPWEPPDGGAGKYDSERAWPWDDAKKLAIETAANLLSGKWPDAARNLLHYLANNGKPLDQDVDKILSDVPQLAQKVDSRRTSLGEDAVDRAKQAGATGPVTFPLNTSWAGYYITKSQSANWFYALGGISYNLTGQVTVYPPSTPGGSWRYVVTSRVNVRDQYNWDGNKETDIGPITVTDQTMADLHRKGLAKEYLNTGSSSSTTTEGTVP